MNNKLIFAIIIAISFNCFGQRETLIPISDIDGSYYDNNDNLIVPIYDIKEGKNGQLHYKDSLIFTPNGKFKYFTYQIFNKRYIVISGHCKTKHQNNFKYILPKNDIIIIDTKYWNKLHYVDLKDMFIMDIFSIEDDKKIALRAVKPDNVEIYDLNNK